MNPSTKAASTPHLTMGKCQAFFDMHMPGTLTPILDRFDPEAFAGRLAAAGVEVVHVFARCMYGYCYYPSRIGTPHPGLTRDFLGETTAACHAAGLQLVAYLSVHVNDLAGREHPEWCGVMPDGSPHLYRNHWRNVCGNTGYRDHFLDVAEEALDWAPVDGLWLDGISIPVQCFCPGCRAAFERATGRPLTPEDLTDPSPDWLEFAGRCEAGLRQAVAERASRTGREVHLGPVILSSVPHLRPVEHVQFFTEAEVWPRDRFRDTWAPMIRGLHKRRLDLPYQGITTFSLGGWGEYSLKGVSQLKYETALTACQGGRACIGKNLMPNGTLFEEVTDTYRAVFDWLKPYLPFCSDDRTAQPVGVLADGYEVGTHLTGGISGVAAAALARHLPFDIVADYLADRDGPESYPFWVVSDRATLPSSWAQSLPAYLEGGGRILVAGTPPRIGGTDLFAHLGLASKQIAPREIDVAECYVRFSAPHPMARQFPYLLPGSYWSLEGSTGQATGEILRLVEAGGERIAQRSAPPGDGTGVPGQYQWSLGKGTLTYMPFSVFNLYWNHGHEHLHDLSVFLLWQLAADLVPFEIAEDYPLTCYGAWAGPVYRLHLVNEPVRRPVNRQAPPPIARTFAPLRDVPIRLRLPGVRRVVLQPGGRVLPLDSAGRDDPGEGVVCRVPALDDYAIVEIEVARS